MWHDIQISTTIIYIACQQNIFASIYVFSKVTMCNCDVAAQWVTNSIGFHSIPSLLSEKCKERGTFDFDEVFRPPYSQEEVFEDISHSKCFGWLHYIFACGKVLCMCVCVYVCVEGRGCLYILTDLAQNNGLNKGGTCTCTVHTYAPAIWR